MTPEQARQLDQIHEAVTKGARARDRRIAQRLAKRIGVAEDRLTAEVEKIADELDAEDNPK